MENENVGVEAAHRTELTEKAVRGASRFTSYRIRTRPTGRVRKWEHRDIRQSGFTVPKNGAGTPGAKGERRFPVPTEAAYQAAVSETSAGGSKTGRAGSGKSTTATEKIARAAAGFVKRHPAEA